MGPLSLGQWRAAQEPPRTAVSVATELDVSHSLLSEWEKGTRKPGVELALRVERLTDGAVPIERWGYTRDLLELMRGAVERRDDDAAAELAHGAEAPCVEVVDVASARVKGAA